MLRYIFFICLLLFVWGLLVIFFWVCDCIGFVLVGILVYWSELEVGVGCSIVTGKQIGRAHV